MSYIIQFLKGFNKYVLLLSQKKDKKTDIVEELKDDNRFHLTIIGIILLTFMFSVSAFISHMESMSYFDAFYACFVTYSAIGFGDYDIYVSCIIIKV